ncbi:MAG: hypothetical protein AAGE59_32095 [Cyanobacteria bacterium P01_F01_bin.86]
MHIKPLEYRVHMALLACISIAGLFSTVRVNNTITAWNDQRDSNAIHRTKLDRIEKRAEVVQAVIDNNVNQYDSVTLSDYICDPDNRPNFNITPYQDIEHLTVADQNNRIIGNLQYGLFYFKPENCTL